MQANAAGSMPSLQTGGAEWPRTFCVGDMCIFFHASARAKASINRAATLQPVWS